MVACSGGADSLALAAGAAVAGRRLRRSARAVVVDHGLQDGSGEIAERAAGQLADLGLDAKVVAIAVADDGRGPEASARAARYAALAGEALPGETVLLGHTLDDQAETVLLGLARGSGTRSLAGMPARRGIFRRPLLGLRRSQTRQACGELGLEWWDDPHNRDQSYARVRARQAVLPMLEEQLGPGIAEALARTARLAARDADCLDGLAAAWESSSLAASAEGPGEAARWPRAGLASAEPGFGGAAYDDSGLPLAAEGAPGFGGAELAVAALSELPSAIRSRVLRDWLRGNGAQDLSLANVEAVDALVTGWRGQKFVEVPRLVVRRQEGRLRAESPARPLAR
ncbi:MAG: tRNA lysidine(34) synthetase TilS [Propionibacteriaceae bacterium]|nr:tRNA lysidine(34) synthetase TilS [Propionibacteriaceae bacterium]